MARPFPSVPHVSVPVIDSKDGRVTRQWRDLWVETNRRIPVIGTATFVAATSVAVTFASAENDTTYRIALLDLPEDNRFWVSGKTTTGFTLNAASASSATIAWALFRT